MQQIDIKVEWSEEDGEWVATAAQVPTLSGIEPTPEKAVERLREAFQMWSRVLEEDGHSVDFEFPAGWDLRSGARAAAAG